MSGAPCSIRCFSSVESTGRDRLSELKISCPSAAALRLDRTRFFRFHYLFVRLYILLPTLHMNTTVYEHKARFPVHFFNNATALSTSSRCSCCHRDGASACPCASCCEYLCCFRRYTIFPRPGCVLGVFRRTSRLPRRTSCNRILHCSVHRITHSCIRPKRRRSVLHPRRCRKLDARL